MENVLRNMYNYYMIHKLNKEEIDTIFSKMVEDGYSFIKIPRDTRDELLYELKIRVNEDKLSKEDEEENNKEEEEKEEEDTQEGS